MKPLNAQDVIHTHSVAKMGLLAVSIFLLILNFQTAQSQDISGQTSICPGTRYTYTFEGGSFCDSRGIMTCVGCDPSTVVADDHSISLTWLENQSPYSVSVPTRCEDDGGVRERNAGTTSGGFRTIDDVLTIGVYQANLNTPNFVCLSAISSTYRATQKQVLDNDSRCSQPTKRIISVDSYSGNGYPFDVNQGDLREGSSTERTGWHTELDASKYMLLTAYWNPNWTGSVTITLQYERRTHPFFIWQDCDSRIEYITTFTWTRSGSPGGSLSGPNEVTLNSSLNLVYQKRADYPAKIQKIRYSLNGTQIAEKLGCEDLGLNYQASAVGQLSFTTQLLDQCGVWSAGPSTIVNVYPSCYRDTPSVSLTGADLQLKPEGYLIKESIAYTINLSGVTDFANNYSINYGAGQSDMSISGSTFSVNKKIGTFQISFDKKIGRADCPSIPTVTAFLSGQDLTMPLQDCPVVLPTDFGNLGFPDITTGNIVLNYFAAIVKSKRAITVKPGITLALGAEMILEQAPPGIDDPADPDLKMNFIQKTAYNEYNQIQAQSRSYFDDQGRALQSQSKNLSDGVVLATSTIYDAYNRPAISTLAAPISAIKVTTDVCTGEKQAGEDLRFAFKTDFIQADGKPYNVTHFDIKNNVVIEDAPVAVENITPGTLGWYYSTNNGGATSDNAKMNEPQVAATNYPYSRTLFHRDGSGDVKGGTKPGDVFTAGLGRTAFSNTDKVAAGDSYLTAYLSMRQQDLGLTTPTDITGQFFKTEATDENGKRAVTYTDKGGKTIISLYFGSQLTPITKSYQFYDNAGRMIASVSPNGVNQYTGSNFASIDKSLHFYNHKGWLLAMEETDAGRTEYVYRKDGKIRFSQNAEQRTAGRYSYTHYDRSGRPIESGEYLPVSVTFKSSAMDALLENIEAGGGLPTTEGTFNNRVFSYYDLTAEVLAEAGNADAQDFITSIGRKQRFVHGAVSFTKKDDYIKSWYSYDDQGRVEWMVQQIKDVGNKTLDYRYGPTGAVREVVYQKGITAEQFTHYYEYDVDGRLFKAYTTRQALSYEKSGDLSNPAVLELQATYFYYLHGPIKRIEYANKLQGIDYTYTPEGSLKSINHFDPDKDPGTNGQKDDLSTNGFRADVFGMTLDYYAGDYRSGAGTINATNVSPDQYGGLIKASRWHGPVQPTKQFGYAYTYDDRYQFKDAQWGQVVAGTLVLNQIKSYNEAVPNYDPNGNIKLLQRHNELGTSVADFNYQYAGNTNQLSTILNKGVNFRGYTYNHIGQMIEQTDAEGKKLKTNYDVTGKVTEVRDETNKLITTYVYDDRGFRLKKITPRETGGNLETVYIRDASGNVVATYENTELTELPVYASGKIGLYKPQYGITFYEVADHLGNVRAVIGDKLKVDYLATLEVERADLETDFVNLNSVAVGDFKNHTSTEVTNEGVTTPIPNPSRVMQINNGGTVKNPIGGGIFLWVHPGDKISTEVFAKYTNFNANNKTAVTGIAGFLASTFGSSKVIVDGLNVLNGVDQIPTGVFTPLGNADDNLPKAFLTYVLLDKNMVPVAFDQAQVSTAAAIPLVDPEDHAHERLSFIDIPIEKEGFIYIYVSNQSDQNMDVYFDDLKVTHEFSDIVAGGDFYPYGLEIVDRQIKRESYRYGYQGKYSELDQETNWNHFELREYDAVIGRTTTPDPAMQFHSSYMWVGNNPIIGTDPTGGLSPIYGKNGKFLGVDSEGFKGKVITMDEGLFNQLTDNGANILDHDFTMSLANNGIFANFLSDGLLSAKAYSRVLTDIVSKTEGITNFGEIKGGGIDIYSWTDPSKRLGLTDLKPTRYQADQNSKSVSMNYAYRNEMNTVESIQSYLGVHEWQGHVIRGYHHGTGIHDKTYGLQRTHSTFPRLRMTNPGLYEEVNQRYSNPASKWK